MRHVNHLVTQVQHTTCCLQSTACSLHVCRSGACNNNKLFTKSAPDLWSCLAPNQTNSLRSPRGNKRGGREHRTMFTLENTQIYVLMVQIHDMINEFIFVTTEAKITSKSCVWDRMLVPLYVCKTSLLMTHSNHLGRWLTWCIKLFIRQLILSRTRNPSR